jgi:hypothetical protein
VHFGLRRVVLGLCSAISRPDLEFLFVPVAAELFDGFWVKRNTPAQLFPPSGDVYVPKDLLPDDFRDGEGATWEVEDQPDYADRHLSCRYRAVRLIDTPLELVAVSRSSTDPDLRAHLQEDGVPVMPRRADKSVLIEFADGLIARTRLIRRAGPDRLFVVPAGDLAHPLEAWDADKHISVMKLDAANAHHRYCAHPVPPAGTTALDLSTLEEMLTSARRAGGLGSVASPPVAELRRHIERLEEAVKAFEGPTWEIRRKRLEGFLEKARGAVEERGRWAAFLEAHPIFRETLSAAITKGRAELRKTVRTELLAEQGELEQRLAILQKEWEDLERVKAEVEEEVSKRREELAATPAEPRQGHSIAPPASQLGSWLVASDDRADTLANGPASMRPLPAEQSAYTTASVLSLSRRVVTLPVGQRPETLSTPAQALALLEKNFQAIGAIRLSARLLAREVLVATSVGQLLLVRGSLAVPVAEAAAVSLGADAVQSAAVPVGSMEPLPVDLRQSDGKVVILEGVNRSCLDAFGTPIQELVRSRVLGLVKERLPVLIGTLGDGPSCLPAGPQLLGYGPVVQTDVLSWNLEKDIEPLAPGRVEPSALEIAGSGSGTEEWAEFIEELFPTPQLLWERGVGHAYRKLSALAERDRPNHPKCSVVFAWILPRFLAEDGDHSILARHLRDGFIHGVAGDDQRVHRLLRMAGVEVGP